MSKNKISKNVSYTTKNITSSVTQHIVNNSMIFKGFPAPNTWIVKVKNDAVLIDSGFGDDNSFLLLKEYINKELSGIKIHSILLTHNHSDHSSGARKLSEYFNASVMIHRLEEKSLRADITEEKKYSKQLRIQRKIWEDERKKTPVDNYIQEGELIKFGSLKIRVIHTPGHTLGSNCYLFTNERILFSGDTILGYDTVAISAPPNGDMTKYLNSLNRLKRYKLKYIAPGHGPIINDPKEKINRLIQHRIERENQIISLIKLGKKTDKSIFKAIYVNLDKSLKNSAMNQIHSHLHRLKELNKIKLQINNNNWKVL